MAALVASPLAASLTSSSANPAGTGLVISEVYGAGGNSGAAYNADYVELHNPTAAEISLSGLSIQYRSATNGSGGTPYALTGTVPAGGRWLVQMSGTGATGAALPTPDSVATPAFNMGGSAGQVALINGTAPFTGTGNVAGNAGLVDFVGYGGTAVTFEGTGPTAAPSAAASVNRNDAGADTDQNGADFVAAAPSPQGQGGDPEPPEEFEGTIAEIQGTGAASPHLGKNGTTQGVVTATYPTGGYNGFYIQTPGTGGATDATPGASDGLFVFGPSFDENTLAPGDLVEVTGPISEFEGTTEITVAADGVTELADAHDPVTALAAAYPTTEADREAHEGELLAPTDNFVVTNSFETNRTAAIGLATGGKPLLQPTDVARPGTPELQAVKDDNARRGVLLDDGAKIDFLPSGGGANQNIPLPYLKADKSIRVGAKVTLTEPVILDFRAESGRASTAAWRLQPRHQVTATDAGPATFEDTRAANASPQPVPGDLHLATFNVLNYFNTTGEAFVAAGGTCTYFNDRAGNPVANNQCTPNGPRGAAQTEDFERQQAKIVTAINKLGADIVALEEIENSVKLIGETNRDDALSALVAALNAAAGSAVWDYAVSPAAADLPALDEQDVIRNAFIYKPATVGLVGPSKVLTGSAPFANAREPLAQAFKPAGAEDSEAFAVVTNHFKSKGGSGTGDNADTGDGQGAFNGDRTRQAAALVEFANAFAAERGTDKIYLAGDFNSYSKEDPIQVLADAGFTKIDSDTEGEASYSFSGLSGSLDHVLANPAALATVAGADIWEINANEPVAFQYSRHNYNATLFFDADSPFAASDHNPEIVGINADEPTGPVTLNLLGVNDFHGRINANTVKWAGTVEQLTAEGGEDSTVMVGAGDLIGASEFASAVAGDQPTIDMFNALGLDASAVGNHEFDKGWVDLRDRVIGPENDRNALWSYLGANVYAKGTQDPVLPEYALYEIQGVTVGVVGAVTEETGSLVSPGGITEIEFGNATEAVNRVAGELSDGNAENGEADVIVATFHAGATQGVGSNYETEVAKGGEFGDMANLVATVDVIFNGHTHQAYAWDAPIPGQPGKSRPIIQTGQYGDNVGQVKLTVDRETGDVQSYQSRNVARTTVPDADLVAQFPRVAQVKTIVDQALANAAQIGNQPVGEVSADITTAFLNGSYVNGKYTGGTRDDRASESTLGDLVANALRDGLPAEMGEADLGIVNPGGLRAELRYAGDTANNPANTDGVVTFAEANAVLPFVNNIWTVDLTGAQLKAVLEQQWQPDGASRPFLSLGLSDNVRVVQDPAQPRGSRIVSVVVGGEPLDPAATYTVSTFSFLGTGGDNFTAFTQGTSRDTGLVDRDLWIQYLRDHKPLAPDFARQQVVGAGIPADVAAGDQVHFTLNKLNLTSQGSPENTSIDVFLRNAEETVKVATVPVTNGSATVDFTAPSNLTGRFTVAVQATPSDTFVGLPLTRTTTTTTATADEIVYGAGGGVHVTVQAETTATGDVNVYEGDTLLGTGSLAGGAVDVPLAGDLLDIGTHSLRVEYVGDENNRPSSTTLTVKVVKATPQINAVISPTTLKVKKDTASVSVTVTATGFTPTGVVAAYVNGQLVDAVNLEDGSGSLVVGPFGQVGDRPVLIRYFGDDFAKAGEVTKTVKVVKQTPKLTLTHSPLKVVVNETKAKLKVEAVASGLVPTGTVTVKIGGTVVKTSSLSEGQTTVTLPTFGSTGNKTVTVTYSGSGTANPVTATHTIRVTR
ncbi:ExeM/NucH family extracellular endonuclease [Nocardioides speluncae]|uniref:ExeM/NucH family extracellular endonuclease n=1 Tax=Nocardioides speluncae TaxID=2670337 RepID=UPI0013796702|nr:ExeM/NucH family extracellular endonuclease [Nocardioides speluncae]